jgi:hypothetical protein
MRGSALKLGRFGVSALTREADLFAFRGSASRSNRNETRGERTQTAPLRTSRLLDSL